MYASIALWPLWSHAAELDLPRQPGTFWLQLDALPEQPCAPVAQADTLHRYGPSLSLAYVIYDFGARAASIDAQRYQLISSLLTSNRVLQNTIAEVEAAYFSVLAARAQGKAKGGEQQGTATV